MSAVSGWLLAIAGVVLLSVLSEFILPEGGINRYVKVIFAIFTLFVVISPLPALLNKQIDFTFPNYDYALQEDYLHKVNLSKLSAIEEDLSYEIEASGLKNVSVSISANAYCESLDIYEVVVNLDKVEYSSEFENKNISSAKKKIEDIILSIPIFDGVLVTFV